MDEKYSTSIRAFGNQKAFTLIELMVVVGIIALLSALGSTYFTYLNFRAGDSHAFMEGRHLMTAVNDAFMNLEDVNFGDNLTDPDITGPVGATTTNDVARPPIFTLSPEIRARMWGQCTSDPGGGSFTAYIWHTSGTRDPDAMFSGGIKEYQYIMVEDTNTIMAPDF